MEIKQLIKDYHSLADQEVTIYGWVRNHRVGKNICFINVNDGTCFETIQVVYSYLANSE